MLIIGTGGLASDVVSSMGFDGNDSDLYFYNDTSVAPLPYIEENYTIYRTFDEAIHHIRHVCPKFIVAIGNNRERKRLTEKFEDIGGININYISSQALIGKYVTLGERGIIVLQHAIINNSVEIGNGSVIYLRASLGHGTRIGEYVLISGGGCTSNTRIGSFSTVGIGVFFKPGTSVGTESFVGVGSVVNKDIPDGATAVGNPARVIKTEQF